MTFAANPLLERIRLLRYFHGMKMDRYWVFRVYIANILLLLLLLTVSQVRCAAAQVYSNQLIKFELLTQSIMQPKLPKNICMEDSVNLFSIHPVL